jgi:hypothetical protein
VQCGVQAGTGQPVKQQATGWGGTVDFRFLTGLEVRPFVIIPTLGLAQFVYNRYRGIFLLGYGGRSVKLTFLAYVQPQFRIQGALYLFPIRFQDVVI